MRPLSRTCLPHAPGSRFRGWSGTPAFTLIELLCVLAIIGILVGLLLGPVGRAFRRARALKSDFEVPTHLERVTDGMRRFAGAHATYSCPDLDALIAFSSPGAPTERWLRSQKDRILFIPFRQDTPPETTVLMVRASGAGGSGDALSSAQYALSKGDLTVMPE